MNDRSDPLSASNATRRRLNTPDAKGLREKDMLTNLRVATIHDVPLLPALIESSVRELQRGDYTPGQIDAALATVYGVDSILIADGTYFVVDVAGDVVACGGWSKRRNLYGSHRHGHRDDALLDVATDAARIRAFFVDPRWSRRGLGSLMLEACENAARAAGFRRVEIGATLTGVRLYEKFGYQQLECIDVPLAGEMALQVVRMLKEL